MLRARPWKRQPNYSLPPRRAQPTWIIVGIISVAAYAAFEWVKSKSPGGAPVSGFARAVDGDSLEIGNERIRLFGIDAPELRQLCQGRGTDEVTCGLEARDTLADLVRGKNVVCTPQEAERSYDRIVALCRVSADGREIDLSETMIRTGHAIELPSHSKGRYAAAEREAKDAKRGIWAGRFERPSEWRQRMGR